MFCDGVIKFDEAPACDLQTGAKNIIFLSTYEVD